MSAVAICEFDYNADIAYRELDEDKKKILAEILPKNAFGKRYSEENIKKYGEIELRSHHQILIDSEQLQKVTSMGVPVVIKTFKGTIPYAMESGQNVGNLHIHLPNFDLHSFNEVTWIEDACTEELQRMLDDGWRILAVCPPKSQRRPDYILAKQKGKK